MEGKNKMKKLCWYIVAMNIVSLFFLSVVGLLFVATGDVTSENRLAFVIGYVWILGIMFFLDWFYFSMAIDFEIYDGKIEFIFFGNRKKLLDIQEITEVQVKTYRYIFVTKSNKKMVLGRFEGLARLEPTINQQILETFEGIMKL